MAAPSARRRRSHDRPPARDPSAEPSACDAGFHATRHGFRSRPGGIARRRRLDLVASPRGQPNVKGPETSRSKPPEQPAQPAPFVGVILHGGGSTFVNPLMQHWADIYEKPTECASTTKRRLRPRDGRRAQPRLPVRLQRRTLTDKQLARVKQAGDAVIHVPLVLGAVVPAVQLARRQRANCALPARSSPTSIWARSSTGTIPPCASPIPASICPTRPLRPCTAPMRAARRSSGPITLAR